MPRDLKIALALIAVVLVAFLGLIGLRVRFEYFTVPSDSMTPTVSRGDLIVVDRWTYGYAWLHGAKRLSAGRMPERGEVVLLHPPGEGTHKDLLKRVIAVGGDRLEGFADGHLELNGAPIPRCEVGTLTDPEGRPARLFIETLGSTSYAVLQTDDLRLSPFEVEVPEDRVFVLGDARSMSLDSRSFGTLSKDDLMGRVAWVSGGGRTGHDPKSPMIPVALRSAAARCLARRHD